jgi:hypothetical protein
MRQSAFAELARDNPDAPRGDVLAATQKLLDRVLSEARRRRLAASGLLRYRASIATIDR